MPRVTAHALQHLDMRCQARANSIGERAAAPRPTVVHIYDTHDGVADLAPLRLRFLWAHARKVAHGRQLRAHVTRIANIGRLLKPGAQRQRLCNRSVAAPRVLVSAAAEAAASCAALTLACRAVAVAAACGCPDAVSHDRALVPVAAGPAAAALLSAAAAARSPHREPADAVHACACACSSSSDSAPS